MGFDFDPPATILASTCSSFFPRRISTGDDMIHVESYSLYLILFLGLVFITVPMLHDSPRPSHFVDES